MSAFTVYSGIKLNTYLLTRCPRCTPLKNMCFCCSPQCFAFKSGMFHAASVIFLHLSHAPPLSFLSFFLSFIPFLTPHASNSPSCSLDHTFAFLPSSHSFSAQPSTHGCQKMWNVMKSAFSVIHTHACIRSACWLTTGLCIGASWAWGRWGGCSSMWCVGEQQGN